MNIEIQHEVTRYHVFTHELDDWFDTYESALAQYNEWASSYGSARLYEEMWMDDGLQADLVTENCLEATGVFPW